MKWLVAIFAVSGHPAETAICLKDCIASPAGLELTRTFEGFMPFVYADVGGKKTVGFGHLLRAGEHFEGMLTPEQADTLLHSDVAVAEAAVNKYVDVALKQNQFDALMDFTFNLGSGTLRASSVLARVNAQAYAEVPARMLLYDRAAGNVVSGLARRRKAEVALYVG